jgi:hypothetical protein
VLVDDPAEQATIGRICELFDGGQSLHKIVNVLTEEGHKPRGKGKWSRLAAARILHRAGRVTCQPWDRSQAGPAAPPPPAQHPGDRGQRPQRDREDKRRPPTHHRQEGR